MADTRERILDAAIEAFATSGYAQTTMDDIAARAGVAKGTLYWNFKGKEELLFAGIDRENSKIEEFASRILQLDAPSLDTLRGIFNVKAWITDDMRRFHKVMLSIWTDVSSGVREKIEARMQRDHDHFVGMTAQLLDGINPDGCLPGVDNRALGTLIHATMCGIFMHLLTCPDLVDLDAMGRAMEETFYKRIEEGAK
jgi:AcrR family transcriptional regulator